MAIAEVKLTIPATDHYSFSDLKNFSENRIKRAQTLKDEFTDRAHISWGHSVYQNPDYAEITIRPKEWTNEKEKPELTTDTIDCAHNRAIEIFSQDGPITEIK